ncbi:kinase suppressor of Ras 2-like isoform X2 [Tigriopus californicus]|uniref:kinase suppressor of Ras 2-like isoform X2 n=1 Tax=Tigriopus californicus TaxID=6832 RepID=UPI0027DA22D8|nr:kinase suppressor of Ras 2-like isoform X2 [Tigriopus californicus]
MNHLGSGSSRGSMVNHVGLSESLQYCENVQHMIEINADHLERLRASPASVGHLYSAGSEITKQEIRTLEGKLVKLFSQQLAVRASLSSQDQEACPTLKKFPFLSKWLSVVGITKDSQSAISSRWNSLEQLKEQTESELNRQLLASASKLSVTQRNEDLRRLSRALQNLRKYTDHLTLHGLARAGGLVGGDVVKLDLHWDSWTSASSSSPRLSSECSSPKSDVFVPNNNTASVVNTGHVVNYPPRGDSASSSMSSSNSSLPPPSPGLTLSPPVMPWPERKATPPTTPPWSAVALFNNKAQNQKFPTTPPPNKKHSITSSSSRSDYPLTKSKSHECELGNRIINTNNSSSANSGSEVTMSMHHKPSVLPTTPRPATIDENGENRLHSTIPSSSSAFTSASISSSTSSTSSRRKHLTTESAFYIEDPVDTGPSPVASPHPFDPSFDHSNALLSIPRSPRTPRSMGHAIKHIFKKTLKPGKCALCSEYMFNGLKCKECKFKCHRDCEPRVPPSCSLPDDLADFYFRSITKDGSPILPPRIHNPSSSTIHSDHPMRMGAGSQAIIHPYPESSSNTSSCNSSTPSSPAVVVTSQPSGSHSATIYQSRCGNKFTFPDPPHGLRPQDPLSYHLGQPPPKVTSPNSIIDSVKSCDSDKTLSGTSGSSGSAGTAYRLDSQDSTASVDDGSSTWNAGRQTSISIREWDIPYEELVILERIGTGRFSTVHQGSWHGDVAIKILDMENMEDEATLEAFRLDVSTFRKTRHENLILFMGACMNPPKLAIVTSLCKGNTLYTHLHLRKDKFPLNKVIIVAQQIAQGMGYLHHRGIVHKDLKTKNIFLEKGHAIISDFGLVNVARRLCARHTAGNRSTPRESMSIPQGWLCYLAPEIMRALRVHPTEGEDLPFTKASDVFGFGTVWYEMLTGEWPWKNQPPETIIWQVGKGMKPSLANLQYSRDVKDILLMCWTYRPDDRPDFTQLSNTLEKIPKKRALARSPSHPVQLSRSAESMF